MSATPILDGEQPLTARKFHWVLAFLGGCALGGVLIALDRARQSPDPLIPPQVLASFLPVLYIAVFVHELGHLIAGVTSGFELRTFIVGAFFFSKQIKGWRFRFVFRRLFGGGLTGMMPRSDQQLVNRYLRFVFGGPAASAVLLIFTFLLPAGSFSRTLLWVNLILILSVCIPYTTACFPNDAKLIVLLTRGGTVAERLIAILYLGALDSQGKRPAHWPSDMVEKLDVNDIDKSRVPVALGLLFAEAAAKEDAGRTAEILERALAMNPKMLPEARKAFLAAASNYHGFHRGDASRAEEWLMRARSVKTGVSQKDWDAKALAAISFAKGDNVQSVEFLRRHIAFLDRQPASGMVSAERERTVSLIDTLTTSAQ